MAEKKKEVLEQMELPEEITTKETKSTELDELKLQVQALKEMLEAQKLEAKPTVAENETVENAKKKEVDDYLNEKIPFLAMKDDKTYKDDIIVGINGKNWQIQRGKKVFIPRFVYNAIMDSEKQKGDALRTMSGLKKHYDTKVSKI